MTDPERIDFTKIIAEIEGAGKSLYYISKLMRRQYVQVKRWKQGGKIEHYEGQMLLAIRDDVMAEYLKLAGK